METVVDVHRFISANSIHTYQAATAHSHGAREERATTCVSKILPVSVRDLRRLLSFLSRVVCIRVAGYRTSTRLLKCNGLAIVAPMKRQRRPQDGEGLGRSSRRFLVVSLDYSGRGEGT
jgi:hypothetical protein